MSLLPLVTGRAWISLPSEVFRTFNGRSRLPVFEIDKNIVQKPYGRVRPLPQAFGRSFVQRVASCTRTKEGRLRAVAILHAALEQEL